MDEEEFIRRHSDNFGSSYEELFVRKVLAGVTEIPLERVNTQTPIHCHGKWRYADFTFEDDGLRLVLEVDGFDKTGRGSGMNYAEFLDWMERQGDLQAEGWTVLRFANGHVIHQPDRLQRNIQLFLRNARSRVSGAGSPSLSRGEALELAELEGERNEELSDLAARLAQAEAEAQNQLAETSRAKADASKNKRESDHWRKEAQQHAGKASALATEAETQRGQAAKFNEEVKRLRSTLAVVSQQKDEIEKDRNKMSSRSLIALATLAGMALIAVAILALAPRSGTNTPDGVLTESPSEPTQEPTTPVASLAAPPPDPCSGAITPRQADAVAEGSYQTVRGRADVFFHESSGRTFINFPPDSFSGVIFRDDRPRFAPSPEQLYESRVVCLKGIVKEYKGEREMIVDHPDDVVVP